MLIINCFFSLRS